MKLTFYLVGAAIALALVAGGGCSDADGPRDAGGDGLDLTPAIDLQGVDEPFGRLCTELNQACPDPDLLGYDLLCVGLQGGAAGKGYCTRTCSDVGTECDGAPNGQMARCFIQEDTGDAGTQGQKYCGFLCKTPAGDYTCPGTLTCGVVDDQGIAICLPQ